MQPGLYLVAVPIGHFEDITLRAINVLKNVDVVYCEDTRITASLFKSHGISTKLMNYHEHNAEEMRPKIIKALKEGKSAALVSDAGTPLISDPGYKLVSDIVENNIALTSLPGPCAAISALAMSALPTDRFFFSGFLPSKSKARKESLEGVINYRSTLVFYESPHRLVESLADMKEVLGDRKASVAREMTKEFEEVQRGSLSSLIDHFSEKIPKGEIVVIVEGHRLSVMSEVDVDGMLWEAMQKLSVKDAAASLVEKTGWSKKRLYDRAVRIKS